MKTFLIVWLGQLASLLGSSLTSFGLGVWIYQKTGSATDYALVAVAITLPHVILSPLTGVVADRWNRRHIMIFSDLGAGIATSLLALLLFTHQLQLWHIYTVTFLSAICETFQKPAYLAAIAQLVPQKDLDRANGLIVLAFSLSETFSPLIAGFLILWIQLQGIIMIDVLTFLIAVTVLMGVRFPSPSSKKSVLTSSYPLFETMTNDLKEAWLYLRKKKGLMFLLVYFGLFNFFLGMVFILITPFVLSFASEETLGMILSIGGIGLILGSLRASTAQNAPSSYIRSLWACDLTIALCVLFIGWSPSITLLALGYFILSFCLPLGSSYLQTLFQKKVNIDLQGRVFALQQSLRMLALPLSYLLAGLLVDKVFEPLMNSQTNSAMSILLSKMIGKGQGQGIALLFIILGLFLLKTTLLAYRYPRIRFLEQEIPDVLGEQKS